MIPTKPGFYWVQTASRDWDLVKVVQGEGALYTVEFGNEDSHVLPDQARYYAWKGPLEVPK